MMKYILAIVLAIGIASCQFEFTKKDADGDVIEIDYDHTPEENEDAKEGADISKREQA